MKRLYFIIKKELADTLGNLPFHIIMIIVPIMFLFFWVINLGQEIGLPVILQNEKNDPQFSKYLKDYSTPDGIRYLGIRTKEYSDRINIVDIEQAVSVNGNNLAGKIVHKLKNIDKNMTKNFRNRITGALTSYIETIYLKNRAIHIDEKPELDHDVLWKNFFVASILVIGIVMGALLYGALGMVSEWNSGTITFLSLSPVNILWILLGKQITIIIKGLVSASIFIVVSFILVPGLSVKIPGLFLSVFAGYWIFGLMGMIIGIFFRDAIICLLTSLMGSLVLWLLGNGFGVSAMLGFKGRFITLINPATYIAEASQHFINGLSMHSIKISIVLGIWFVILQGIIYLTYRYKIYLSEGIRS